MIFSMTNSSGKKSYLFGGLKMNDYFSKLLKYNDWANKVVVKSLQSQNIKDQAILRLLSHIVLAEQIWMIRMQKGNYEKLDFWKQLSLQECEKIIKDNFSISFSFIGKMNEKDFKRIVHYKNSKGIDFSNTFEDILTHLSHHSAYHRAQIARDIRKLGYQPAITDYIAFIRG